VNAHTAREDLNLFISSFTVFFTGEWRLHATRVH
jgi:hypothetical protein